MDKELGKMLTMGAILASSFAAYTILPHHAVETNPVEIVQKADDEKSKSSHDEDNNSNIISSEDSKNDKDSSNETSSEDSKENGKEETKNNAPVLTIKTKELKYIVGDKFSTNDVVFKVYDKDSDDVDVNIKNNVDTSKPGTYYVHITCTDSHGATTKGSVKVIVVKNEAPVIECVDSLTLLPSDKFDISMLKIKAYDKEDGNLTNKVVVKSDVKNVVGTYKVCLSVKDSRGLETTKEVTVNIVENKAPVIECVNSLNLNIGDDFDYSMLKASAKDDFDGDLSDNIVYSGDVDTSKSGTYTVVLTVKDSKGLESKKSVEVTVTPLVTSEDITITQGDSFSDDVLKQYAIDHDCDPSNIHYTGNVNTNVAGTYNITLYIGSGEHEESRDVSVIVVPRNDLKEIDVKETE